MHTSSTIVHIYKWDVPHAYTGQYMHTARAEHMQPMHGSNKLSSLIMRQYHNYNAKRWRGKTLANLAIVHQFAKVLPSICQFISM